MQKLKTQIIIGILLTVYFLINGFIPREKEIVVNYGAMEFHSWELYAKELQNEGYTHEASTKIAKVEFKLLPIDEDYLGLKED
jgi:hypothetical protein